MYRRFFDLDQGPTVSTFLLQPVSLKRINSIEILAAAQIPVRMKLLVGTADQCFSFRIPYLC